MFWPCLAAVPVAVGSQEAQQQQQQGQRGDTRGDGDVPHLGPPGALLLPPLQVAELAALPHVARHTAAKERGHTLQWWQGTATDRHPSRLAHPFTIEHHHRNIWLSLAVGKIKLF